MSPNRSFGSNFKATFLLLFALCLVLASTPAAFAACSPGGTDYWKGTTGGGSNNLWSNQNNWDTSPASANRPPNDGDYLNFESGAAQLSNSNDNNACVSGITFAGGGYTLATNALQLGAGGINNQSGSNTISLNLTLFANQSWTNSGTSLTHSGSLALGTNQTLTIAGTGSTTLSGAITGSGTSNITKTNAGTLIISNGTNSLPVLNVNAGVVNLSGKATAVNVNNSGTLFGTGSTTGALTVASGGSFKAGTNTSFGTFTVGSAAFSSGSTYYEQLSSNSNFSTLSCAGCTVSLGNAALVVQQSYLPPLNQVFTIINTNGGTVSGTFNGLANGASFTVSGNSYTINYTTSTVTLTNNTAPGSTFTWTGTTSNLWSVAGNWGGTAPSGNAGEIIIFPTPTASNPSTTNDFGDKTSFQSVIFQGNGYAVAPTGANNSMNIGGGGFSGTNTSGTNSVSQILNLTVDQSWTQDGGGTLNLSGNVTMGGFNLNIGGAGTVNVSGNLLGAGSITKVGTGNATFSGAANTFSGNTAINAGTLFINSSLSASAISMSGGGTLGGTSTVKSITSTGGNLSPGASVGAVGTLTTAASGNVSLDSNSTYYVDMTANGTNDKVVLGASASFTAGGAQLVMNDEYGCANTDTFTIESGATSVSGTFSSGSLSLTEGAFFTQNNTKYQITYLGGGGGHDIIVTCKGTNTPPIITSLGTTNVTEGATETLTVNFTDPNTETHSIDVNWGDGTTSLGVAVASGSGAQSKVITHTYKDNKPSGVLAPNASSNFTITATITDTGNATDSATASPTISNATPSSITINKVASTINEGGTASLTVSFADGCPNPNVLGCTDDHNIDVDWGDGGPHTCVASSTTQAACAGAPSPGSGIGAGVFSKAGITHIYANNTGSPFTITAKVTDEDNANASNTTTITVNNVAPTLNTAPNSLTSCPTFTFDGVSDYNLTCNIDVTPSWTDPGSEPNGATQNAGFTVVITYFNNASGLNPPQTFNPPNLSNNTISASVSFKLFADYSPNPNVCVVVKDDDNASSGTVCNFLAINTPPTNTQFTSITPSPANEGQLVTASGSFSDPDASDTHRIVINWGDGSTNSNCTTPVVLAAGQQCIDVAAGVLTFSATHTYADNGVYNITLVSNRDSANGTDALLPSAPTPITINNVAPASLTVTPAAGTINENGTDSVSGTFTDPGTLDTHTVDIDWGDGSTHTTINLAANVLSYDSSGSPHTYLDNGVYTVTVTVTDKDGGSTSNTTSITVNNVAPSALVVSATQAQFPGDAASGVSATFTDPGTLDTHQVTVDWGDGTAMTVVNLGANVLSMPFQAHAYASSAGSPYTVTVTVTDKDGGSTSSNTTKIYVPDFSMSSSGSATVKAGSTGQFTIFVLSLDPTNAPFNQVVNLSCTAGVPTGAMCSIAAPSLTPGATAAPGASTALSISTNPIAQPVIGPFATVLPFTGLGLVGVVVIGLGRKRDRKVRRTTFMLGMMLVMLSLILILPGCGATGASNGNSGGKTGAGASTPPGSYTITVTGTSATNPADVRTTTVTLNVN